jgi:hypothetical protein
VTSLPGPQADLQTQTLNVCLAEICGLRVYTVLRSADDPKETSDGRRACRSIADLSDIDSPALCLNPFSINVSGVHNKAIALYWLMERWGADG